jgi:uncharacterized repeat protein (TIGR03803 family)
MKTKFRLFLAALLLSATVSAAPAALLMVTNSADSGSGTLRQAILDANADASPDLVTVGFNIPGAGVHTIAPLSALPTITRPVTIDGYTQPGTSPNTFANADNAVLLIELSGGSLASPAYGLWIAANGCTVRGMVINRFTASTAGILVQNSDGHVVEGNFIGTDATGTNALGNESGVLVLSGGLRVGGSTPAARNVIGGSVVGVNIVSSTSNQVVGNFVGIGADGTTVVPNTYGMYLQTCFQSQIGGSTPGARNVISGNANGCFITGGGSNFVQGNFIGTDVSGTLKRANVNGVAVIESANNLIGGTDAGNLCSGNSSAGVYLSGASTSNNIVTGNLVGTDASGTNALGNETGIYISAGTGNRVGGLAAASRNIVAGNLYGIYVNVTAGSEILGNYIGVATNGLAVVPNTHGIYLYHSLLTQIGSLTPGARNVISGNASGCYLNAGGSNLIQGNFIGTDASGTLPRGNVYGVAVNESVNNLIGGTDAGAGNLLSGNVSAGVLVTGSSASNNVVAGNRLFDNGALGIDLGDNGMTLNDSGDVDDGPNHFQNFPEITAAALLGGSLSIRYRVDSTAMNSAYPLIIEFFVADSFVSGEGQELIHRHSYETPQAFTNTTFIPAVTVNDGDTVVATATDANGNTSEFSTVATAAANHSPAVANPIPDRSGSYGSTFSYTFPANTFSDPDAADTLSYAASGLPLGITFNPGTRAFSGIPTIPGTFSIIITATDDGTPPLETNDVFDVIVAKAPLIVTADNKSRLPGQPNPPLTGSVTGVTNSDNITATFETPANESSPAGDYPIRPLLGDPGSRLPNYNVSTNAGTLAVVNCSALAITNAFLPSAVASAPYSVTVRAANGGAPYSFAITGGALPANLVLAAGGLLSGTATNTGNFSFTITATDAVGCTVSSNYMLAVVCSDIALVPIATPRGLVATSYSRLFTAKGGNSQKTFAVTSGGLPPELSLSGDGVLSGIPTDAGSFSFTITATDATGCTGARNYAMSISPVITITPDALADANSQLAYSQMLTANGGTPPYSFEIIGGALPRGLTISSSGELSGVPAFAGAFSFKVSATDAGNLSAVMNYSLNVVGSGFQRLKVFGRPDAVGGNLIAPLIEGTDGRLYGTAQYVFSSGGLGGGVVFSLNKGGSDYTLLHRFASTGGDGQFPHAGLVEASDGMLYGTTFNGGNSSSGTIFKLNKNGTGYSVIKRYTQTQFEPSSGAYTNDHGANPSTGSLVEGHDGALYGTTSLGGGGGVGTAFKINKDGGGYTVLRSFSSLGGDGRNPHSLLLGSDGVLYGTTLSGGVSNSGTIFVLNQDGSDYTVLRHFTGSGDGDGHSPRGVLLEASDGTLYGTTASGGTDGFGTVFKLNKDGGGYAILRHFSASGGDGFAPYGGVVEGLDGALYGTTSAGGAGGYSVPQCCFVQPAGTVFKLSKNGSGYQVLRSFAAQIGDARTPEAGLMRGSDGALYGTTVAGGKEGLGTVFKSSNGGSNFGVLRNCASGAESSGHVIEGSDGPLYGIVSGANEEGPEGYTQVNELYRINKDGSGYVAVTNGVHPSSLLEGSDGVLYGRWGAFQPIVTRVNKDGSAFDYFEFGLLMYSVSHGPFGPLIEAADGGLYGTTFYNGGQGINNYGTVYRMNKDGTGKAVLVDFAEVPNADHPNCVIQGSDDLLYGTCGASFGFGPLDAVFKVSTNGAGFTILKSFATSGGDGRSPQANLLQGTDGALYGSCAQGGSNGFGTVFKLNKDGSGYTVLHNFTDATGGALVEGSGGRLYGTTYGGGASNAGTLFMLNKDGSAYTVLWSFTGLEENDFSSRIFAATDGAIYRAGGTVLWRFVFPNTPPSLNQHPTNVTSAPGNDITLCVTAAGSQPLYYQWRRNGVNLPDATNSCLTLFGADARDGGSYDVVVYNSFGAVLSDPGVVVITVPLLPPGDNLAARVSLPSSAGTVRGSNVNATAEAGEPNHAGKPGGRSVWYAFTSPAAGVMTIDTAGSSFDTLLAVYTGTSFATLVEIASDEESGGALTSEVRFNVQAGVEYEIAVDGYNGAVGNYVLNWSFVQTANRYPVIETHPASATVAPGANHTFSASAIGTGLTYSWSLNGIAVPNATAASLTVTNIDENDVGTYVLRVTQGTLFVDTHPVTLQMNRTGAGTQLALGADKLPDAQREAPPITLGEIPSLLASDATPASVIRGYTGTQILNTYGAGGSGELPICGVAGGASVWVKILAAQSGVLHVNTDGSSYNTVIAIYDQSPGVDVLRYLDCDNNGGIDHIDSAVAVSVLGGRTNFVQIDGVNGATGILNLNYSLVVPSTLTPIGPNASGQYQFLVVGRPEMAFTIQHTTDFATWATLHSGTDTDGSYLFTDMTTPRPAHRIYRLLMRP